MDEINARRQIKPKRAEKSRQRTTSSLTGNFQFPFGKGGQGTMKQMEVKFKTTKSE